ncbi:hypothetical protein [Mycobacteroides abscessus]|uniref:hypothetical protein n=1 Tax=Mycobacteroides abscessus TaxID=36809 RepID=UPI001056C165|nr:hypothetical protein [Mycobacteroides abscessus]
MHGYSEDICCERCQQQLSDLVKFVQRDLKPRPTQRQRWAMRDIVVRHCPTKPTAHGRAADGADIRVRIATALLGQTITTSSDNGATTLEGWANPRAAGQEVLMELQEDYALVEMPQTGPGGGHGEKTLQVCETRKYRQ